MRDYAYEAALSFANRIRKEDGKKPLTWLPKGVKRQHAGCPLARATGRSVTWLSFTGPNGIRLEKDAPRDVRRFVRKFDNGKYPELIA